MNLFVNYNSNSREITNIWTENIFIIKNIFKNINFIKNEWIFNDNLRFQVLIMCNQ